MRVTHGAEAVERTYDPLRLLRETSDAVLRALCNDVRARQVASLTDYIPGDDRDLEFTGLANCLMGHAQRALSTPETEVAQDEWDLTVFGQNGTVSFTGISQPWLREAAKRWAADDLPKRRVRSGRRTSAGLAADLPAAVLADLLGMHINTAVRWVKHVGRDWADYIAARAIEGVTPDGTRRIVTGEIVPQALQLV